MANAPTQHRPLLDPRQMEEAGRTLRRVLEKLKAPRPAPKTTPDDIAWEDGEPHDDQQSRYG